MNQASPTLLTETMTEVIERLCDGDRHHQSRSVSIEMVDLCYRAFVASENE